MCINEQWVHNFMHILRRHFASKVATVIKSLQHHQFLSNYVGQIRLHKGIEGGEVRLLSDFGAQRGDQVSLPLQKEDKQVIMIQRSSQVLEAQWLIEWYHRSFLTRAYPTMKKNNPHTPIMLRDAAGTQPRVYARYGEQAASWCCCSSSEDHVLREKVLTLDRIWEGEVGVVNG